MSIRDIILTLINLKNTVKSGNPHSPLMHEGQLLRAQFGGDIRQHGVNLNEEIENDLDDELQEFYQIDAGLQIDIPHHIASPAFEKPASDILKIA